MAGAHRKQDAKENTFMKIKDSPQGEAALPGQLEQVATEKPQDKDGFPFVLESIHAHEIFRNIRVVHGEFDYISCGEERHQWRLFSDGVPVGAR
jgi:hypothetical protein